MRTLPETIEKLIALVPDDYEEREDLIDSLDEFQDSLVWVAPEAAAMAWIGLSSILVEFIGHPNDEWEKDMQRVISDTDWGVDDLWDGWEDGNE